MEVLCLIYSLVCVSLVWVLFLVLGFGGDFGFMMAFVKFFGTYFGKSPDSSGLSFLVFLGLFGYDVDN